MKGLLGVRKGAWNKEEDDLLRQFIEKHGEGKWHQIPLKAGLNRCRKSCRLRWLNYLKPTIKRGEFTEDEIDLMLRLHKLLGNRWSLIAGRLPGRTASDVKNYWSARLRKKMDFGIEKPKDKSREIPKAINIIRPQPRTFKKSLHHSSSILEHIQFENNFSRPFSSGTTRENEIDDWWKTLYDDTYSSSVNRVTCSSSLGLEEDLFKDFWVEDMKKAFDDQEAIGLI